MLGYEGIPDQWKSGIPAIADKQFSYTDFNFNSIVKSTEDRAIALVELNGGRLDGDRLLVKMQEPQPAQLELWDDYGSPDEVILVEDARWQFEGDWERTEARQRRTIYMGRTAGTKGPAAEVSFQGTGAILSGPLMAKGGTADIYLDGELHGTVDVYSDSTYNRVSEAVWHAFGLPDAEHRLRVVVRGEVPQGGQGTDITLEKLIVFR